MAWEKKKEKKKERLTAGYLILVWLLTKRGRHISAARSQKLKFADDLEKADGGEQGRSKKFDSFIISGELLDTKF